MWLRSGTKTWGKVDGQLRSSPVFWACIYESWICIWWVWIASPYTLKWIKTLKWVCVLMKSLQLQNLRAKPLVYIRQDFRHQKSGQMDVMVGTKGLFSRLWARTVSKIRQPVSSQFETTIRKAHWGKKRCWLMANHQKIFRQGNNHS